MKCDKLKAVSSTDIIHKEFLWGYLWIDKNDVDAAIAELKAEHHKERDEYISMVDSREQTIKELKAENDRLTKENKVLKVTNEKYPYCSKCADGMGKVFDEELNKIKAENERLKNSVVWFSRCRKAERKLRATRKALYKALANWAHEAKFVYDDEFDLWDNMERRCLKKAEEFK